MSAGLIAGLIVLALLMLLWLGWSLLRGKRDSTGTALQAQKAVYRQREAELSADLQRGAVTTDEHAVLLEDLQKQLLSDVDQSAGGAAATPKSLNIALVLLVPLIAGLAYHQLGAWNDLQLAELQNEYLQQQQPSPELVDALLKSAERGRATSPEKSEYSVLSARLYMEQQNYTAAAEAYRQASGLHPENAELLALWAQADYLARDRKLTVAARQALKKSLTLNPNNPTALGLLGLEAFVAGRLLEAIDTWQQLLAVLPPRSQQATVIRDGLGRAIAMARSQGLLEGELTASRSESAVTVTVQLAEALQDKDIQGTLFVFAKADDGMPMPLAVSRQPWTGEPLTVTLSDKDAMLPNRKLSDFERIRIEARISRSGTVSKAPGDAEGVSEWIASDSNSTITITIGTLFKSGSE